MTPPIVRLCQLEGIDNTPALPLAVGMLIASAKMEPQLTEHFQFEISIERTRIPDLVESFGECAVLGFSLYPWNTAYSLAVIEQAKVRWPGTTIIVGGPSLPKRREQITPFLNAHPAIDVLMSGESEVAFRQYLLAVMHGKDPGGVDAIVYRADGELVFTSAASRVTDFSQTASPYLDGTFDALMERYPHRFTMGMLETNRGCPFSCTFCDWSLTKQVIELPLERVLAEVDWLTERGIGNLCIVDANFGIRRRDHTIARHIASKREVGTVPSFCYFYLTKNNYRKNLATIEIFRDAGVACSIGLAVQDFDETVLDAVKRDNIQTEETFTLRRICAERGIPSRNELIFGLPGQTYDSFANSIIRAMPPFPDHECVVFICRLLDNTELGTPEQRALHAIETRNCAWRPRSGVAPDAINERQQLVVSTKTMPLEDWKRTVRFTYLASAGYNQYLMRVLMRGFPELFDVPVRTFLEHLLNGIAHAPAGSALADLRQVFDRYIDSILSEGPYMLQFDGTGATNWDIDEALTLIAYRRIDEFLHEVQACCRALVETAEASFLYEEMFRFQQSVLPNIGDAQAYRDRYQHDWVTWFASIDTSTPLVAQGTSIDFTPPLISSIPDFGAFMVTYCGMMKARTSSTTRMRGFFTQPSLSAEAP
jgi:hypothetical protein